MDWRAWLLGAGTLLVGQLLGLGSELIRRRWSETAERNRRLEERSEAAARTLLDLLDEARRYFDGFNRIGIGPDDEGIYDLCHRMDREALMVHVSEARRRLGAISEALWYSEHVVSPTTRHSPQQISFMCYRAGEETLGALLLGEPITQETWTGTYADAVKLYQEAVKLYQETVETPDAAP